MNSTTLERTELVKRRSLEMALMPMVMSCQSSLSSTSATATSNLLRTRLMMDLSTCRFPLRERFSGRRRLTWATPTFIGSCSEAAPGRGRTVFLNLPSARGGVKRHRGGYYLHLVEKDRMAEMIIPFMILIGWILMSVIVGVWIGKMIYRLILKVETRITQIIEKPRSTIG